MNAIIPDNPVTMEEVAVWYRLKAEIEKLRKQETLLRPRIFKYFFPNPKEGVNNYEMPDNFIMKGTRRINRSVDIAVLTNFRLRGPNNEPSVFERANINPDNYFAYKPELKVGEYRKLTADELKIVDQCLVIKDGMPDLDIVPKKI